MRPCPWLAALALSALIVASGIAGADVDDPGGPQYANNVLSGFVTPVVAPGDTVHFSFNISNPYGVPEAVMQNVSLTVGIYMYATRDSSREVDADFSHPPEFDGESTETTLTMDSLPLDTTIRVNLTIETSENTPHGSYFSQSTYFVRFSMSFNFTDNTTIVVLKSRGCFTEEQWDNILSFDTGEPLVDREYLKSLGVDGLLPDSAFGIKAPIPHWPLAVIVGASVAACVFALYYYVIDNPGSHPRLEKRFYYLRGKLGESWSKLKNRGRK